MPSSSSHLRRIVAYKREELEHLRRRVSLKDVRLRAADAPPARALTARFGKGLNIIAEMKRASPSAGLIRPELDPAALASAYAEAGAKAISVLTDAKFFQGSLDDVIRARGGMKNLGEAALPILRKDFTLDEYHVYEARGAGADAVLLIVAALDPFQLKDYHDLAIEIGLTPLTEVHAKTEVYAALETGAVLIGINNRDLNTLETDPAVTLKLLHELRESLKYLEPGRPRVQPPRAAVTVISESGLDRHETLVRLREKGVDGFLIGEGLLRDNDPGAKLRELLGE